MMQDWSSLVRFYFALNGRFLTNGATGVSWSLFFFLLGTHARGKHSRVHTPGVRGATSSTQGENTHPGVRELRVALEAFFLLVLDPVQTWVKRHRCAILLRDFHNVSAFCNVD